MTFTPPRGNAGRTGLGAVGGARGVGAGALRLIIEFLTSYNPEAIKAMEADLQRLTGLQKQANSELAAMEQTRIALQNKLAQGKQASLGLDRAQVESINALGAKYAQIGKLQGTQLQQALAARDAEVAAIAQATGLDEKDILYLSQKKQLQAQIGEYLDLEVEKRREIAALNKDIRGESATLGQMKAAGPAGIGSGLAALGIGAIGAAAGFAVLGPLLSGVSEWMDKVVQSFVDFIDPAKKAEESIKKIGEAIDQAADSGKISKLQAAKDLINDIRTPTGESLTPGLFDDKQTANLAEQVALNKDISEHLQTQLDLMKAQTDSTAQVRQNILDILIQKQGFNPFDPLVVSLGIITQTGPLIQNLQSEMGEEANRQLATTIQQSQEDQRRRDLLAQQEAILRQQQSDLQSILSETLSGNVTSASNAFVDDLNSRLQSTLDLYDRMEQAQVNVVQGGLDRTISGIQDRADERLAGLQKRLDALAHVGPSAKTRELQQALEDLSNRGPSARTLALQKALEQLSKAEDQRAYKAKLADIAQERREIILKHQLENAKTAIDITKYQGRERLIALDAELARQERANEAQKKYNELLSIQYEFTRRLTREQGESIQEFQERQAQRNRDLLQKAAELRQDDRKTDLEDQRDKVQYQLDLEENAAKKRDLMRQHELKKQQEALQKQLKASQEHDRKVLDNQRDALQKRLKASQEADQRELETRRKAIQAQMDAVRNQAQNDIENARKVANERIANIHRAFDDARDQTRKSVQDTIEAEQERAKKIAMFANASEVARLQSAIAGAHNMQELQQVAGYLAGSQFSDSYISAQLNALGVDPYTQSIIMQNIRNTRSAYQNQLNKFQTSLPGLGLGDAIPGAGGRGNGFGQGRPYAQGGFFELTNGMNFGKNARFGEEGPEIGFVLTNKLSKMFKETQQAPLMGNVTFNGGDSPSKQMYYLKRTIKEVLREEQRK